MAQVNPEQDFLHDLINRLTLVHGKLNRMISKSDRFTKDEIMENMKKTLKELDLAFELITLRKKE